MSTEQEKIEEVRSEELEQSPAVQFARYCEETPWAVECKIYEE